MFDVGGGNGNIFMYSMCTRVSYFDRLQKLTSVFAGNLFVFSLLDADRPVL